MHRRRKDSFCPMSSPGCFCPATFTRLLRHLDAYPEQRHDNDVSVTSGDATELLANRFMARKLLAVLLPR